MSKARTPEMRRIEEERERRLNERGLVDTSLLDRFAGFPWQRVATVRQQLEEGSGMAQNLELLNKAFPRDIIEQKQGFDYIPHPYVTERLNQALGVGAWSFEVKMTEVIRELDTIVVLGRLTAQVGDAVVIKEQYGGQTINRKRKNQDGSPGEIVDISNDYKGAASDALKKCATLLGVGEELYMNGHKPPQEQGEQQNQAGGGNQTSGAGLPQPRQNGPQANGPQPKPGNPASDKQVNFILGERKRRDGGWELIYKTLATKGIPSIDGMGPDEAKATVTEYLHRLSSQEASDLITALKALPEKAQQQTA